MEEEEENGEGERVDEGAGVGGGGGWKKIVVRCTYRYIQTRNTYEQLHGKTTATFYRRIPSLIFIVRHITGMLLCRNISR